MDPRVPQTDRHLDGQHGRAYRKAGKWLWAQYYKCTCLERPLNLKIKIPTTNNCIPDYTSFSNINSLTKFPTRKSVRSIGDY